MGIAMTDGELPGGPTPAAAPAPRGGAAPPVWPAFAAYAVALAGILGAQVAAGVVLGVWYVANGGDPRRLAAGLRDLLTTPPGFPAIAPFDHFLLRPAAVA